MHEGTRSQNPILINGLFHRVHQPKVPCISVNAAVLLQFLLMQIRQFSVQIQINIFLEVSPIYYQFRPHFLSMCRPSPLFLFRIDPAAANIFTYLKIFFVLGTGAPRNFGPNL
jgi:hypothetical protein